MRIGVDGQALVGGIPTGFGVYAKLLERALSELQAEGRLSYHIFKPGSQDKPLRTVADRLFWERFQLPRLIRGEDAMRTLDIFHSPCLRAPFPIRMPLVVTIHDLITITHPPKGIAARYYFCGILPAGWKRAKLILCDSSTVKNEVVEYLQIPHDRVRVIYLYSRFERKRRSAVCEEESEQYLDIKGEAFDGGKRGQGVNAGEGAVFSLLLVGSLERRKNFQLAVQALSKLPKTVRDRCALNIAGLGEKGAEELLMHARRLGLEERIKLLGYLSEKELFKTYKKAFLLIAPSKEEGFNLPPLEAMSLGVPVLLSDIPVHREVYSVREKAHGERVDSSEGSAKDEKYPGFFNPDSPQELAELIARTIEDESFYEKLKDFGRRIASALSMERFKRELLSAYESIALTQRDRTASPSDG